MKSLVEYIKESMSCPICDFVKKYQKTIYAKRDTWGRVVSKNDFDNLWELKDDGSFWREVGGKKIDKSGAKLNGPWVKFYLEDDEDPTIEIYLDLEFDAEDWDSNGVQISFVDGDKNGTVGPIFVKSNEKELYGSEIAYEISKDYAQEIYDNIVK
ncbi:MAG: hypothetical protein J1F35_05750 [Erysipelotrichales bacterium]|nr:hypothetical protein [Erysipelotrichales bacterium]